MKKSYSILTFALIILMFFTFTYTVFGESPTFNTESSNIISVGVNPTVLPDEVFHTVFKSANQQSNIENSEGLIGLKNGEQIMFATVKNGVFSIDKVAFDSIPEKNVVRAFHFFIKNLESMENDKNRDEISSFMSDLEDVDNDLSRIIFLSVYSEIKGDMYGAYTVMNPFLSAINVLLGVAAVLIICLLLLSTLIDLCYLGFSFFKEGWSHFLVSYEAKNVEFESQRRVDGEYQNKYFEYFKDRSLTYIVLSICITYLICGGLSGIIAYVLSLVNV